MKVDQIRISLRFKRILRAMFSIVCFSIALGIVVWVTSPYASNMASVSKLSKVSKVSVAASTIRSDVQVNALSSSLRSRPVRFLLLGDSIGLTLGMGLGSHSLSRYGVIEYDEATLGCDLDPNLLVRLSGKIGPSTPGCPDWRVLWPQLIKKYHPDVVGLELGRWETPDYYYKGHWVHVGQPVWDAHLVSELDQAVRIFSAYGAHVILLNMPFIDPSGLAPNGKPYAENTPVRVDAYNLLVNRVQEENQGLVSVIDLNALLDPKGSYTSTIDGIDVRWSDGIHVSVAGGEWLQPKILPTVRALGLSAHLEN